MRILTCPSETNTSSRSSSSSGLQAFRGGGSSFFKKTNLADRGIQTENKSMCVNPKRMGLRPLVEDSKSGHIHSTVVM